MSRVPVKTFKPFVHRTVNIKNRSLSDDPHQERIDVPVLSNHFVRKRMINEWSMRGVCEFERCVQAFFVTLTYKPELRPKMYDGRLAFCNEHLNIFLNRIKVRLERDGIGKGNMKYFIVSEKGSKNGAPHYHCIFYFYVPIVTFDLGKTCKFYSRKLGPVRFEDLPTRKHSTGYFHQLVKKYWTYGFSDIQVPRNGSAVVKYISGYVCKDLFSIDLGTSKLSPDVREWHMFSIRDGVHLDLGEHISSSLIEYRPKSKSLRKKLKGYYYTTYNFHRQSLGFGDNILDMITPMNWQSGCMTKVIDGVPYTFALPKYARDKMLRRLEYFKDENGVRHCKSITTPLGEQVRAIMSKKRADDILQWLDDMFNSNENQRYVSGVVGYDIERSSFDLSLYFNTNEMHHSFSMRDDFTDYIQHKRGWFVRFYGNKFNHAGFDDMISGYWISPCGDIIQVLAEKSVDGSLKPPLWNKYYLGYERLLRLYDDVQFALDCAKQREDERNEFLKKRNKYLGYG